MDCAATLRSTAKASFTASTKSTIIRCSASSRLRVRSRRLFMPSDKRPPENAIAAPSAVAMSEIHSMVFLPSPSCNRRAVPSPSGPGESEQTRLYGSRHAAGRSTWTASAGRVPRERRSRNPFTARCSWPSGGQLCLVAAVEANARQLRFVIVPVTPSCSMIRNRRGNDRNRDACRLMAVRRTALDRTRAGCPGAVGVPATCPMGR